MAEEFDPPGGVVDEGVAEGDDGGVRNVGGAGVFGDEVVAAGEVDLLADPCDAADAAGDGDFPVGEHGAEGKGLEPVPAREEGGAVDGIAGKPEVGGDAEGVGEFGEGDGGGLAVGVGDEGDVADALAGELAGECLDVCGPVAGMVGGDLRGGKLTDDGEKRILRPRACVLGFAKTLECEDGSHV